MSSQKDQSFGQQISKNVGKNFQRLIKQFNQKPYKKPLLLSLLAVVVVSGALGLGWTLTKQLEVAKAGNSNGVILDTKYLQGSAEVDTISVNPGGTVTQRIKYNNTTAGAISGATIATTLPNGFTLVPGTITNHYVDATAVALPDYVFNGANLAVSPVAGYFGYPTNSTSGILDMGKKKYIQELTCTGTDIDGVQSRRSSYVTGATNSADPNTTMYTGGESGHTNGCADTFGPYFSTPTYYRSGTPIVLDITGQRYLDALTCTGHDLYGVSMRNTILWGANNAASSIVYTGGETGHAYGCADSFGPYFAGSYYSQGDALRFDSLGQRYFHQFSCNGKDNHGTSIRDEYFPAVNGSPTALNGTDATTCGNTFGPYYAGSNWVNNNTYSAYDLLDQGRGYGYIEFQVKAPTTPGTYTEAYNMVGSGVSNLTDTGSIAVSGTTVTNANVANSGSCVNTVTVQVPNKYDCTFPLTGDQYNSYVLPAGGVTASTSTATGNSDACTIDSGYIPTVLWYMNGTSFASGRFLPQSVDKNWFATAGGDFNKDGNQDLVWRNNVTGQTVIWLLDSAQNILPTGSLYLTTFGAGEAWAMPAIGDFNGDGNTDIVWRNQTSGRTSLWTMNGTTITNDSLIADQVASPDWNIEAAADFNGDGKADLVWRNQASGENVIWYMNGGTRLSFTNFSPVADSNWFIRAAADFSGDGKPDLLWYRFATGDTTIWEMNNANFIKGDTLSTVGQPWYPWGAADFNKDGKPDIFWRQFGANVSPQTVLRCSNIPTTGGTNGVQSVTLSSGIGNRGQVTLGSAPTPTTPVTIDKKFIQNGSEQDNANVSQGATVTERIYYNNTSNSTILDSQIQSQFPAGFTVTGLKNCLDPNNTQTNADDSCSSALPTSLVNSSNQLKVSPVAGLYDASQAYSAGTISGTAANAQTGILEIGKLGYIQRALCRVQYSNNTESFVDQTFSPTNNSTPSVSTNDKPICYQGNNPATPATSILGGTVANAGWGNMSMQGKRYMQRSICRVDYSNGTSSWIDQSFNPINSSTPITSTENPICYLNGNPSTPATNILGGTIATSSQGWGTMDMLGKRYMQRSLCVVQYSSTNTASFVDQTFNPTNSSTPVSGTENPICYLNGNPSTPATNILGGTIATSSQGWGTMDMLDSTRGRGYIEVTMTAPSTAGAYTQTANLTGTGLTGVTDSGIITVTNAVGNASIDKKFVQGNTETDNVSVTAGSTITERIRYSNTGSSPVLDAQVQSQFPTGFAIQSLKTCLDPNNTITTSDDVCSSNIPTSLVNGSNQLKVSPVAGLYDAAQAYTAGSPSGTATNATQGILEIGKKRYLNQFVCAYTKPGTDQREYWYHVTSFSNNLIGGSSVGYNAGTNGSDYCNSTTEEGVYYNSLNPKTAATADGYSQTGFEARNVKDTLNKRYLNQFVCAYGKPGTDKREYWYHVTSFSNNLIGGSSVGYNAGTNGSDYCNSTTEEGVYYNSLNPKTAATADGYSQTGFEARNVKDTLGKRYMNQLVCAYGKPGTDQREYWYHVTSFSSSLIAGSSVGYNAGTNGSDYCNSTSEEGVYYNSLNPKTAATADGYSQTGFEARNVRDTLDTTRGEGYIEVTMTAPSTAGTYTQTANLTGSGLSGITDSGLITVTNLNDNVKIDKKFVSGASETDNISVVSGGTVTERIRYNNTGGSAITNAQIASALPSGFTLVAGSVKNNYVDAAPITLPDSVFSGSNLAVAPTAGYFGISNNSSTGTLDLGKKKYLALGMCEYAKNETGGVQYSRYYGDKSAYTYNIGNGSGATNTTDWTPGCTPTNHDSSAALNVGATNVQNIGLTGNRYFHLALCEYGKTEASGVQYSQYYGDKSTANYNIGNGSGANNSASGYNPNCTSRNHDPAAALNASATNTQDIELLGNRYFHLALCEYGKNQTGGIQFSQYYGNKSSTTFNIGNGSAANNSALGYNPNCTTTNHDSTAQLNGPATNVQDIDLLDSTRGYGYIEFQMKAPTTAGAYNQTANLTGTGISGITDTGVITVTPNTYTITGANIGVGTCNPATVTIGTAVDCTYPLTNIPTGATPQLPSGGVTDGISTATGTANCTITTTNLVCTAVPTTSGTAGNQQATPSLTGSGSAPVTLNPTTTVITTSNISNSSDCTSTKSVTIPNTYSCLFYLTGDPGSNYTMPTGGIQATTSQNNGSDVTPITGGYSPDCTLLGSGTGSPRIQCDSIPSTGGTAGLRNVLIKLGTTIATVSSYVDKGDVTLKYPDYTITGANIGTGTCSPSSVIIGTATTCTYPLTGIPANNNPVLPASTTASVSTATGTGTCILSGTNVICSSIPTTSGTAGLQSATPSLSGSGTAPITLSSPQTPNCSSSLTSGNCIVTGPNIGAGTCNPATVTIGTNINCSYPITGIPTGVTPILPLAGVTDSVTTATGTSQCQLDSTNANLLCNNIPTTSGTAGAQSATPSLTGSGTANVTLNNPTILITPTNIGNSTDCTSTKNVTIPATYTCNFPLTGSSSNNYSLPTTGITAGTQTATGQSPACSITNPGTSTVALQCASIPTTSGTPGVQNVLLTVGTGTTPVDKGDVNLQTTDYPITGPNISNGTCNPSSTTIGTAITCTYPIINIPSGLTPVLPTGGVKDQVSTATGTGDCTISGTNLVCSSVPTTGATAGNQQATPNLTGAGNAPIALTPTTTVITGTNIGAGTCNPSTATIGATLTCTYPLTGIPANSTPVLPTGGVKDQVSTATGTGDCTISTANLVCTAVPTTSGTAGNQQATPSLTGSGSAPVTLNPTTTVITTSNISNSSDCTSTKSVTIPNTYSCLFYLTGDPGSNYTMPTGGIQATTSQNNGSDVTPITGGYSPDCTLLGSGTGSPRIQCDSIPSTGGTAGLRNVLIKLGTTIATVSSYVDKGDVTLVIPNCSSSITSGICVITGPNIGAGTCNPATVTVGISVNCTYPLTGIATGVTPTLPTGGVKDQVSTATGTGDCTINVTNLVCTSVPTTGATAGNQQATPNLTGAGNAPLIVNPTTTTITLSNIGNSSDCTSTKNVTIPATYTCNFPLTGDSGNNYSLPTTGITAGTQTATGQSPTCTITNPGTSTVALQCASIPTISGTPGTQNVLLTVGTGGTPTDKGDVKLVDPNYTITGSNVGTGTCTPMTVTVGSTITCTYPLTGLPTGQTPQLPSGGVTAGISTATGKGSCTISGTNLVCSNIPSANATPGNQQATPSLSGSGSAPITVASNTAPNCSSSVTSGTCIITGPNISSGTCTPASVTVGSTINCTYPLVNIPTGVTPVLPTTGVTDGVTTATGTVACTITGTNLTCSNVPTTGATPGNQSATPSLTGSGTAPVTVTAIPNCSSSVTSGTCIITGPNISTGTCTPPTVNVGSNINCAYPIINIPTGVTPVLPTIGVTAGITTATGTGNCTISSLTLVCSNIPTTGANAGTQTAAPNLAGSGTAPVTVQIPFDPAQINPVCNSGQAVVINSTTTCTFTLPTGATLPTGFQLVIGNGTPGGTCTVNGSTVTCSGVPTGNATGQQTIYGQLPGGSKVDTGDKASVYDPGATIRSGGIAGLPILIAILAAAIGSGVYIVSRRRKMNKIKLK